jgi:hypothetical protein
MLGRLKAQWLIFTLIRYIGTHRRRLECSLELSFVGHLELVATYKGIESWKKLAYAFITP